MISSFCTWGNCVQVDPAADGGVYVSQRLTTEPAPSGGELTRRVVQHYGAGTVRLRFTAAEWEAFLRGVLAGEFTPEALRGSESRPRVAGGEGAPDNPCTAVTSDLRAHAPHRGEHA